MINHSLKYKLYYSSDRKLLFKGKPLKRLTVGKKTNTGRNNQGRITVRHIGGGHKQKYRIIDFNNKLFDIPAKIVRIEYDPNRTGFVMLLQYNNGLLSYKLAPQNIKVGDNIINNDSTNLKPGNTLLLKDIPVGSTIYNLELKPGKGAQLLRSAGVKGFIVRRAKNGYCIIKLNSGEQRLVSSNCLATLGAVSNTTHRLILKGKAGRNRWLNRRPSVRGVAMNPIDHPHGGGEGKTSGGRPSVSPTGKLTKGKLTRRKKYTNQFIYQSRRY
nr:ribosomal protein L2 [Microheliella maris]